MYVFVCARRVDECFGPFLDRLSSANSSTQSGGEAAAAARPHDDSEEAAAAFVQLFDGGISDAGAGTGEQPQPLLPDGVGAGSAPLRRLWRVLRYAGFCHPVAQCA